MRRTSFVALMAAVGLAVAVVPGPALADAPVSTGVTRLGALAPSVPHNATRLGRLPSTQPVTIEVMLQPSHPAELSALLDALYDPSSPRYQQWLTPSDFAQQFGPSAAQVSATIAWLHEQGLTDTSASGFAVRATGSSQAVADALGVSFSRYQLPGGSTGYAASSAPLVPRALVGGISAIVGLSDTVRFRSHLNLASGRLTRRTFGAVPGAAVPHAAPIAAAHAAPKACTNALNYAGAQFWTPDQVGAIYGVNKLFSHGLTGQGRTIGMLELAPSRPADTRDFQRCFGLHNTVSIHKIDGGSAPDAFGTLEAEIDIQEAAVTAPGAAIRSYEAPNNGVGEYDAYNQMIHDNVTVISTSWGRCESALESEAPGFMDALHLLFRQAAAQGQSVFAADGDKGSEDCYDTSDLSPDTSLQVDNPANDPYVTGVGGTSLGAPGIEPVWNDCEGEVGIACAASEGDASGGGQSTHFARPSWQPKAADAICLSCRGVPDISANAGVPETFYDSDFAAGPDPGPDHWVAVGGTSIAAPKLAGLAADIASGCTGGRVGNFARKVDTLATKKVYGTALTDVTKGLDFTTGNPKLVAPGDNDVTRNNSRRFKAAAGYDLSTGIGIPIAPGLTCPEITKVTPSRGHVGNHVTLQGLGLERATIKFGKNTAKVLSATATTAVVVAPPGFGAVNVSGSDAIGTGTHHALFDYPGADTTSYRTVALDGGIFTFGGARFSGSPVGKTTAPVIGMAVDHATGGYWLASSDGNVYNFNAPNYGTAKTTHLNQPIVGIAATNSGDGYWLVARDGGIFSFGNAHYYGSAGGRPLNKPIVGIAADEVTGGYRLVASDGGIFSFHAPFYGSTGALTLNKPIVGMIGNAATGGYWLIASDGGVFSFHAPFYGSTGALTLNKPIVGAAATGDARGYWFVASDGGVFSFGDARFAGSMGGAPINSPMIAIATAH